MRTRASHPLLLMLGLVCAALAHTVSAQEHPYIAAYTLTEFDGGIRIDWTILGGSTCDGQDVERSTDGVTFTPVHRIQGLCGDPLIPRSYDWIDPDPPEFTLVHYRVKLGVEGYTSVKVILFDQLTTSDQRFFPSPMDGEATLVVNLTNSTVVDLRVWNAAGQLVLEHIGAAGPSIQVSLPTAPSGLYVYSAVSGARSFSGWFIRR